MSERGLGVVRTYWGVVDDYKFVYLFVYFGKFVNVQEWRNRQVAELERLDNGSQVRTQPKP